MFRHVLRHRLVAFLSYRAVAFNTNGQIHFGIHYALWAGLTARPHERLCISSVCSSLQDLPTEVKPETSQDKKKRRKKVTKEKVCEELSLDENGKDFEASKKKTRKRRTEKVKRPEKLTSDVWVNENQAEDRPPPLSFPFEGSSYAEADDEFGLYHHGSRDMHCSGDKSVIHREENYSSEDRYYRISSAGVSVVYPSVTTVLRQTVTKGQYYMLRNWRRSMIKEHGEEEFQSILKQIRNTGTHFHQNLEQKLFKLTPPESVISIKPQLSGKESHKDDQKKLSVSRTVSTDWSEKKVADKLMLNVDECAELDSGYMKSVGHVLEQFTSVLALESVVTHHELGYTGTLDCVVKYKGEVCLVDWKSSAKPKPTLDDCYDFPLQAVAYAGAVNYDDHYPFTVLNALIVVAYADGEPAHAHFLSHEQCQHYWSKWLHRLQEYQTQFASDHSNLYL